MKSLFVPMLSSCFVLGMAGFRPAVAQPGAPRQAGVNDQGVVQAARFAVNAQQQAMKSAGNTDELSLVKVVSARSQVVAGVNFILTLQVKEGGKLRTADATVWWQAWCKEPYKLTFWKITDEQGDANAKPAEGKMESGKPLKLTDDAVAADNDFAADLYRQLAKEQQGKNLFFSPYSMLSALAMTAEGCGGETALQMGKALCFPAALHNTGGDAQSLPWSMTTFHAGMAALNARYNPKPASKELLDKIAALRKDLDDSQRLEKDLQQQNNWDKYFQQNRKSQAVAGQLNALLVQVDQYELRVANALWAEKTYPFSPAYLDTMHKFYGTGGAFPADFNGNPEGERQKINAWVQQQTNDRIQDLMPPRSIDHLTRLVLTNAIYFKGQWSKPFDAGDTKDEDFLLAGGTKVSVPMMHNSSLGGRPLRGLQRRRQSLRHAADHSLRPATGRKNPLSGQGRVPCGRAALQGRRSVAAGDCAATRSTRCPGRRPGGAGRKAQRRQPGGLARQAGKPQDRRPNAEVQAGNRVLHERHAQVAGHGPARLRFLRRPACAVRRHVRQPRSREQALHCLRRAQGVR